MKQLVLLRHAKSAWGDLDLDDHARPLNKRGKMAAPVMGRWLNEAGLVPDIVICSDAVRTRETLALVLPEFDGEKPELVIDEQLYLAPPETILKLVKTHGGTANRVMVIAHNPGLHALALRLAGSDRSGAGPTSTSQAANLKALAMKFPTAAVAAFDLGHLRFGDVLVGQGTLVHFKTPTELGAGKSA